jgi:ubiquinone/menaquinone biosynthesis C-methylase UbiE
MQPTEEMTYWERISMTKWGAYTTKIERDLVDKALCLSKTMDKKALEIGCEGGRWSKLLSEKGWSVTCTDINSNSLNVCKSRITEAQCVLVCADDRTLPFQPKSATLLLCIEVFPLIHSDWFIQEANRVLALGGLIVTVVQNRLSYRSFLHTVGSLIRHKKKADDDFYAQSYHAWRERTIKTGFEILYDSGFCWPPFSRHSNSSLIPFFFHMEHYLGLHKITTFSPWIALIGRKKENI